MARPKLCGRCRKQKRPKGKAFKDLPNYCECGRPTKFDQLTILKLEEAFANGLSDEQACAYANVSKTPFYNYQQKNPQFKERKEQLKMRPDIKAKSTAVKSLEEPIYAWRWLERKDPEFLPKTATKETIEITDPANEMGDEEKKALAEFRNARRKRIESMSDKML